MRSVPKVLPPHGDSNRYIYGCRCDLCRRAACRADTQRRLDRMAGRSRYVPASDVLPHLQALRATGLVPHRISSLSGVPVTTVRRALSGTSKWVERALAEKMLAVPVDVKLEDGLLPALGSTRRIQALYALGHRQADIARDSGLSLDAISSLANGRWQKANATVISAVRSTYNRLSMTVGESWKSRRLAEGQGWAPPLAWDDEDLDDPNAVPQFEAEGDADEEYVDEAAVRRYLNAPGAQVTDDERLAAIVEGVRRGMAYIDVDALHNLEKGTTQKWMDNRRLHAKRHGLEFPVLVRAGEARQLTKGEVVLMRERAAVGETQVQLSLAFDVATSTVARVVRGERYAEHGGPITKRATTQPNASSRLLFNRGQAAFAKAS